MRVTTALSPSLLHRIASRTPLLAGLVCAALALSGCAGRSVLGEKPAATKEGGAAVEPASGAQTSTVTPLQKFLWVFSPYRPVIQQGNFISEEMLAQLKVGMSREQVRFILGTPLLTDVFHGERWDYPFRLAKGNGELTTSRVVVFFKDGKVERFEGGNLPTEKEYIARIAGPAPALTSAAPAPAAKPPTPAPTPEVTK
ncbi:outer membrane protein assembly factor BamE [Janthinobacterium sp. CG_23.3]|uniref:outer membrane protein assembly factor BamE n=1 Tax=unclassified Janthinobacterium TaxID=2610881 RepID=UPI00034B3D4F|nr:MULTISPECIES: outer membrane protein assembly factor BamE [unclassified Janthinobacterium]MEC5162416.1 outer membrane protein assembly factor BamE [Janthinobacterium sp. CG_S6]